MSSKSEQNPVGKVFGARVREARKQRGWSQRELAERVGVDRLTVTKIEQGGTRADVRLSELLAFSSVLGVAPVHMLTPLDDDELMEITPGLPPAPAKRVRAWIRGWLPTRGMAAFEFVAGLPESEQRELIEQAITQDMDPLSRALMAREISESVDTALEEVRIYVRRTEGSKPMADPQAARGKHAGEEE